MSTTMRVVGCLLLLMVAYGCTPGGELPAADSDGTLIPGEDTASNDAGSVVIRGRLTDATSSPAGAEQPVDVVGCVVVAVSGQTGLDYRGTVDEDGDFSIDILDSEAGSTFILTILGSDGRPVGPVLLGVAESGGLTGLKPAGPVELGTLVLPEHPDQVPITLGDDADVADDEIDPANPSRLDGGGVPVGLASLGKGAGAMIAAGQAGSGPDADKDGLVDLFDADDDGDGTVDDFEAGAVAWQLPVNSDVRVNFFMNLKVPMEESSVYYSGTSDQIDAALSGDTVITFECLTEPGAKRSIASAHLLATPAPAYLPGATLLTEGVGTPPLWSSTAYAFNFDVDRYEAFVVPNAVMQAGDTFTVEIAMSDGATITSSRMLNYIFKRIPRVVKYGSTDPLQPFDPSTPAGNGSLGQPTPFDGTADLVVEFAPPEDENGDLLTGLDYTLEFFFYGQNAFPIDGIDVAATWPTPVPGTRAGSTTIEVSAADLALTGDGTYVVTIPQEMFVDQATLTGGGTANVEIYKMDITAQCPSGNAAIMWALTKQ